MAVFPSRCRMGRVHPCSREEPARLGSRRQVVARRRPTTLCNKSDHRISQRTTVKLTGVLSEIPIYATLPTTHVASPTRAHGLVARGRRIAAGSRADTQLTRKRSNLYPSHAKRESSTPYLNSRQMPSSFNSRGDRTFSRVADPKRKASDCSLNPRYRIESRQHRPLRLTQGSRPGARPAIIDEALCGDSMYSPTAKINSSTSRNTPRFRRLTVRSRKNRSTIFSHDALVDGGMHMEPPGARNASPARLRPTSQSRLIFVR
jgi:hypothetical protein